eukprot:3176927-Ditylum_brightwellii.AAC.1
MLHFVTSNSGGEHRGIQIRRRESQECMEGTKGGLEELDRKKQVHVMSIIEDKEEKDQYNCCALLSNPLSTTTPPPDQSLERVEKFLQ